MTETLSKKFELFNREFDEIDVSSSKDEDDGSVDNLDPFLEEVDSAKEYTGISRSFSKRANNQIRKFRQSVDASAKSKRIDEEKRYAANGYNLFDVVEPPHSLEAFVRVSRNPVNYAAMQAKVTNIVGLGFNIIDSPRSQERLDSISSKITEAIENEDEEEEKKQKTRLQRARASLVRQKLMLNERIEDMNEEDTFIEIMKQVFFDREATGTGYLEIGRADDGTIGYLGHIPSVTMRIRRQRDGFVQLIDGHAQFFANFGATRDIGGGLTAESNPLGEYVPNEVIAFKKHSLESTYYGMPDILAAEYAIAGYEYAARYNLEYFENKGVPRYVIISKGMSISDTAKKNMYKFFETSLQGQHHRTLYIPLKTDEEAGGKTDFKIEPVEASNQDSSFTKYSDSNRDEILMVHRVPLTKVLTSSGTNLSVARDADKTFKEQVCQPEQEAAEKKINRLIREFTDALLFKLNEMTLTDADTQSKIDERDVRNGIKLVNEIRNERGLGGIEGGDERVDPNARFKQSATDAASVRARDSERSANATDSRGEGRNPKGEGRTPGTE